MTAVRKRQIALVGGLLLVIEFLCRVGLVHKTTLAPPSVMLATLADEFASGRILPDLGETLICILASTIIATIGGFVVGLVLNSFPRLRDAVRPILASYYSIPIFAFYPALAAILGLGIAPIIITAVLNSIVGMIIATEDALDRFPRVLVKLARTHRFTWWQQALHLQLPAMLPNLLGGVKLVVAYSFIGVIGSEFLMAAIGVGYQISYSYNEFNVPRMYGLMLLVVILVALANLLLNVPERRFASRAMGRRGE
ncbi:MAG: nitrate transporter permease [Rhodospirillales bacterium]|nr:nitrate transporter permease [Rhodospirillales bacterium]